MVTQRQRGASHLATFDLSSGTLSLVKDTFTDIYNLVSLAEGKKGAGEDVVLWSSIGVDMEQYKP